MNGVKIEGLFYYYFFLCFTLSDTKRREERKKRTLKQKVYNFKLIIMADFSNPYGSAHSRAQANKKTFEALERSERKKQEEELKKQKDLEEISRNIKRREERLKAQEFGVDSPFAVTVVPPVEKSSPTMRKMRYFILLFSLQLLF